MMMMMMFGCGTKGICASLTVTLGLDNQVTVVGGIQLQGELFHCSGVSTVDVDLLLNATGIETIIVPETNLQDFKDASPEHQEKFKPAATIWDVVNLALIETGDEGQLEEWTKEEGKEVVVPQGGEDDDDSPVEQPLLSLGEEP